MRSIYKVRSSFHRREVEALTKLAELRAGLLSQVEAASRHRPGRNAHRCCQRPLNQMRISPLEARAIELTFRSDPELRRKLARVLDRLEAELPLLASNTERQSFNCPLLEGTRCLVHAAAKPIGCLAWNPGKDYTKRAWEAFAARDDLNDALHGTDWKLRVIPLWLKRVFGGQTRAPGSRHKDRVGGRPKGRVARREGESRSRASRRRQPHKPERRFGP